MWSALTFMCVKDCRLHRGIISKNNLLWFDFQSPKKVEEGHKEHAQPLHLDFPIANIPIANIIYKHARCWHLDIFL